MKKVQKYGILAVALMLTVATGLTLAYTITESAPGSGTYDGFWWRVYVTDVEMGAISGAEVAVRVEKFGNTEWELAGTYIAYTNASGIAEGWFYCAAAGIPVIPSSEIRIRIESCEKADWYVDYPTLPGPWKANDWSLDSNDNGHGGKNYRNLTVGSVQMGYGD